MIRSIPLLIETKGTRAAPSWYPTLNLPTRASIYSRHLPEPSTFPVRAWCKVAKVMGFGRLPSSHGHFSYLEVFKDYGSSSS